MADKNLEQKIKDAAKKAGLTETEAHHTLMGSEPVGALGDGVFLAKFLKFLQLILPIILPLIGDHPAPAAPATP